jgi:hypothetical protein
MSLALTSHERRKEEEETVRRVPDEKTPHIILNVRHDKRERAA